MFSKLVCRAVEEGLLFTITLNANIPNNFQPAVQKQISLSCSEMQRQRRDESPGSIWGRTPLCTPSPLCPAHRHTQAGVHTMVPGALLMPPKAEHLRGGGEDQENDHHKLFWFCEFWSWDSLHRIPAADLCATHSRPDTTVVGGMPSCLCGRRVSSLSTINSF